MSRFPPEYWVVQLDLGDHKVYLRSNYWTFYMQDIQFAKLFSGQRGSGRTKAERVIEHLKQLITSPHGYFVVCESNFKSSPQIKVTDVNQLSAKQINFTIL